MNEWTEIPCECGFISEENMDKFEKYEIEMVKWLGECIPPKNFVTRCKKCKTIALIEKRKNNE